MHASVWRKQCYSQRLLKSRQRSGFTQAALAKQLGVEQFSVSRMEKGMVPREPLRTEVLAYIEKSESSSREDVETIAKAVAESDELRQLISRILVETMHK